VSDNAKAFIDELTRQVAQEERASGQRKNRRGGASLAELWCALEAFVGDLLRAAVSERAQGFVYRSMDAGAFSGEPVSFRTFTAMLGALKGLKLVEQLQGRKFWARNHFAEAEDAPPTVLGGHASRFKATQRLIDLCARHGIPPEEIKAHFIVALPDNPLVLKSSSTRVYGRKFPGRRMRYEPSPKAQALRDDVKRLNAFLDTHELRGGTHRGYIRGFNQGDLDGFDWNKGGRLYSQGEGNYQSEKKDARLRMTIDGEPVVEIDIRGSYLTMLHGLQGFPFDVTSDPYDLEGVDRQLVKLWTVATLGSSKHFDRWPRALSSNYEKETGKKPSEIASALEIRKRMIAKHPVLGLWNDQGITWADLMFHESQAMLGTMLELMRREVPSLSVHDSLIVRETDGDLAQSLLKQHYERFSGIVPELKVNRTRTTTMELEPV
jgi:hypothetical protein